MTVAAEADRAERAKALAARRRAERRSFKHIARRIPFYLLIGVIFVFALFPFYWAVRSAFMPDDELFLTPVKYIPTDPTLAHFRDVLSNDNFQHAFVNSTIVAASVTVLALAIGSLAAYALGRFSFRGRTATLYLMLSMTIFPQIAILGALYTSINKLGIYNTLQSLIFSYMIFTLPFTIWVLTSFMRALPKDLEEAAYIDGAGAAAGLLPRDAPAPRAGPRHDRAARVHRRLERVPVRALLHGDARETHRSRRDRERSTGESGSAFQTPWGQIMAATVLVTLPLIVMTLVLQRRILAGLTAGAVKG